MMQYLCLIRGISKVRLLKGGMPIRMKTGRINDIDPSGTTLSLQNNEDDPG
jgi:hypothetical protein